MKELEEYNKARTNLFYMFEGFTHFAYSVEDMLTEDWDYYEECKTLFFGEYIDQLGGEWSHSSESSDQCTPHLTTKDGAYHMFLVNDDCGGDPYYMIFADKNKNRKHK